MKQRSVYIVEDSHNSPGRILAVFADEEDAQLFAYALHDPASIMERTLWYEQPPILGVNT
jgi:hypothetical protein